MDEWAKNQLRPQGVDGWVFWSEAQHNLEDWQNVYWGGAENYAKLRAVKDKYDPDNVLTCHQCVGWEDVENVDPATCPAMCSCSNAVEEDTCVNEVVLPSGSVVHTSALWIALVIAILSLN
jgi:hypothetical protein